MALQNSRNSSMADDDEKRLIEVLDITKFKTPSKDASSMGPNVSLSSIPYIDLTILEDVYWCDFSRFFPRDLMGFLGDFITIANLSCSNYVEDALLKKRTEKHRLISWKFRHV